MNPSKADVLAVLTSVTDPELGINVVDLGLIYDVRVSEERIDVDMTLTSPGCPMARMIASDVEHAIEVVYPGREAHVQIVWDPPWTTDRLSGDARRQLGYED